MGIDVLGFWEDVTINISTPLAKAEVQKVGVQEVKERMSIKVINTASSTSIALVFPLSIIF
jgi:hypothetical protein